MTRPVQTTLLLGVAVIALTACGSGKGPGALGSKDDIVVRNNGLPGTNTAAPMPPSSAGDTGISTTVENVAPNPAADVPAPEMLAAPSEELQPLPDADPAVDAAAHRVEEAQAPVPATTATPMNDGSVASTAPATETVPSDIAPQEPVAQQQAAPVPAPTNSAPPVGTPIETTSGAPIIPDDAPQTAVDALGARAVSPSSVYPAEDYPAEALVKEEVVTHVPPATQPLQQAPASVPPTPAEGPYSYKPVPAGTTYKADPNAPFSPSAVKPAAIATSPATTASVSADVHNPATIRAAQGALKLKGFYAGAETGAIDAAFLNALSKYQGDNGLPVGGLNLETLRSLGVVQ